MVQGVGALCGFFHGLDRTGIQCADIYIQAGADRGDLLDFFDGIGHDGGAAAGQQDVGHVAYGHVVGDAVDQGLLLPYVGNDLFKHRVLLSQFSYFRFLQ